MCFVFTNVSAAFCRLIGQVFGDIMQKFCLLHVDDFFVYCRSFETHLEQVEDILKRLENSGLVTQPKTCSFGKSRVQFFCHEISKESIASDPESFKQYSDIWFPTIEGLCVVC